jgi:hypothetical protein
LVQLRFTSKTISFGLGSKKTLFVGEAETLLMNHLAKIVSSYRKEKNEMTIIPFSFFSFIFSHFFPFSFYLLSSPHGLFFCSLATHAHERPSGRTRTLAGGLACTSAPPIPNQAPAVARSSAIAPRLVPSLAPASLTAPPLRPVSSQ